MVTLRQLEVSRKEQQVRVVIASKQGRKEVDPPPTILSFCGKKSRPLWKLWNFGLLEHN
jgi:hypothetical protein